MNYLNKLPTIYIGYDPKEDEYYRKLKASIERHCSRKQYNIVPLVQKELRKIGLYTRGSIYKDGQSYDMHDNRPFSTEFSFTRFLVPHLNQRNGLALYMDCDMLVTSDITEVFDTYGSDSYFPISCVKHDYVPLETKKFDGSVEQTTYYRKNWSSFVLWHCNHPEIDKMTVSDVNTKPGSWLHGFKWLKDEMIGSIPHEWNWLDGHSPIDMVPKNIHFTTGGPLYPTWRGKRDIDTKYAVDWRYEF